MKILALLICSFLLRPAWSKVIKYEISGYKRTLHSYEEVCKKLGHKELLLVEVMDALNLDCMGSKVSVKDFCLKNNSRRNLLRGFVNEKMSEVTCQYGSAAILSIACDKKDKFLCANPKQSCENLNNVYALTHELFEYSFIEKDVDNILNCMYQSKNTSNIEVISTKILLPFEEKEIIDRDIFALDKSIK